jgi:hypothetical protein
LKQGTESERESGGRNIFNFWKQNRGERGEGGWPNDQEGSLAAQPALIVVNARNGEDKVAQPIR